MVLKIPVRQAVAVGASGCNAGGSDAPGKTASSDTAKGLGDVGGLNENPEEVLELLVSRPVVNPTSLASGATRAYWAVNKKTQSVQFFKDTWRINLADIDIEGATLRELNSMAVQNVPTVVCFGDVSEGDDPGGLPYSSYWGMADVY